MSDAEYRRGQCGRACHPDRYIVMARRVRLRKTWFVRDQHIDRDLRRPYSTEDAAEFARMSLARMEMMERHASERGY